MYKLTKLEKEILKICNLKHPEPTNYEDFDVLKSRYNERDIYLTCKYLDAREYFASSQYAMGGIPISLTLGHLGFSYKERSRLETKEFLFKSVAVPIAVSFATTMLTIGLS